MNAGDIQKRLGKLADRKKAELLQGFFKTGPGQYGEGDVFLGITVPVLRKVAKESADLPLVEVARLLKSPVHEQRLLALFLLIQRYSRGNERDRKTIFDLYVKHSRFVNNWDLVDLSAPHIVGHYLLQGPRKLLYDLAVSKNLWSRRIAIVSTLQFIRLNDFKDTLKIAVLLLDDVHDLIHKATGWMLREVGKRDQGVLETFLSRHCTKMPRTMLRYAIERFPEKARREYLNRGSG